MLEPGARAPEFELAGLSGGARSLQSLASGSGVVLAFFKVSCPTCQFTLPFLERMNHGGKIPIYAVSQDDAEPTREFHLEFGITLPTLLDTEERGYPASNGYGISHVPSLFLVEPDGRVSWTSTGFRKRDLEELGHKLGVTPFRRGESVPESKSG